MYHDYNRIKQKIKSVLVSLAMIIVLCVCAWCLVTFIVFYFSEHNEEVSENVEVLPSESASVIHEQKSEIKPSTTSEPTLKPVITPTPLLSSTPALESAPVTPEPIPSVDDIQTECTEDVEPTTEPVPERENTLYCFIENGIRTDVPVEYQDYLYNLLKEYGHEDKYELVMAMIYHESNWQPDVVSRTHDYGLMQINRCNHSWLREKLGISDFLDPYQSMDAGVYMICDLFDRYDSTEKALVCYNMGEGGARGISSSRYSRGVLSDKKLLVKLED